MIFFYKVRSLIFFYNFNFYTKSTFGSSLCEPIKYIFTSCSIFCFLTFSFASSDSVYSCSWLRSIGASCRFCITTFIATTTSIIATININVLVPSISHFFFIISINLCVFLPFFFTKCFSFLFSFCSCFPFYFFFCFLLAVASTFLACSCFVLFSVFFVLACFFVPSAFV